MCTRTCIGRQWLMAACLLMAAGCQTPDDDRYTVLGPTSPTTHAEAGSETREEPADSQASSRSDPQFVELGTGEFAEVEERGESARAASEPAVLNFNNTSIADAVKVVLGDLLGKNYIIDPQVRGMVTLNTVEPIAQENWLPTLELLLRMNDAAVVLQQDIYRVIPRDQADQELRIPQIGDSSVPLPAGNTIRVVPIKHIAAGEMAGILEPFAPAGNIVRVDTARNWLLLMGDTMELDSLVETIRVFDVDWLKGLSFGLFTPDFVQAGVLAEELSGIFGNESQGPLAGLVRIKVIKRMNALLVVSPRPEYLEKVEKWIERLDVDKGTEEQGLFVYPVQNGKASDLASVLAQVFEGAESGGGIGAAELAPGLEPVEISSEADGSPDFLPPSPEENFSASGAGISMGKNGSLRVIADSINNVLLIRATSRQYRQVMEALRKIDIAPLQVLIEATIAEVTLTGEFSLGLEWFLKTGLSGDRTGDAQLDLGAVGLSAVTGFSYVIRSSGDIRFVLNALASDSRLNIISSPSLMVLNHQEASIQVGDQVPITTQQQQATATDSNIINNIEFRDTGILLNVRPRVNANGLVVMEVEQEVSDVAPKSANSLTPTIQQRKINSTVAVQSGETVVLGGLIRENKTESESGVPGLSKLPVLGFLFGATKDTSRRTELVVLITPRAVRDPSVSRQITEEFRERMESLKPLFGSRSETLAPREDGFSTALDQDGKVVRVADAVREASAEGAPDAEGDKSPRGSAELDFEADLESTTPPESPPSEGEEETVRMPEILQAQERGEAEPAAPGTVSGSAPVGPVLQILSARNKGKVEKELSRLREHGHDVFLEEFRHHGTLWHRLKMRVAPGQRVEDAKEKLKGLGHDAVWIVPED